MNIDERVIEDVLAEVEERIEKETAIKIFRELERIKEHNRCGTCMCEFSILDNQDYIQIKKHYTEKYL